MIDQKEGRKRNLFFTQKFFIIGIIFLFLLTLIFFPGNFKTSEEALVCGDGTLYNECSMRRPYFCLDGTLIEVSFVCHCPSTLMRKGNSCVSKYQTFPKNITLKYVLRGEEKEIDFTVYEGIANYTSELPRDIFYKGDEEPSRRDFKLMNIDEREQRESLLHLVTKIQNIAKDKDDQVRIAVSLVQKIPFKLSDKLGIVRHNQTINYSRYPYEVLYETQGVCGEKSELLAFLLREMGYGVVLFYHKPENHESLGIRCPIEYSLGNTGYCFVETSGPSIITNNELEYVGGVKLYSEPELILISEGDSLGEDLYEYKDALEMIKINNIIEERGSINFFQTLKLKKLKKKYGLVDSYDA